MQQHADNRELEAQLQALTNRWQAYPEHFAIEALGVTPTRQQTEAMSQIGQMVRAKMKYLKKQPLTHSEEELVRKLGISIMSGKGTGKDSLASWMTLWFHCMFKNSKVIVTGPSRDQLRDVFMAETSK